MTTENAAAAAPTRKDGLAKVSGAALYTADHFPPGLVHGVLVSSTIASGNILAFDLQAARSAAGVIAVLTHQDMPRLGRPDQAAPAAMGTSHMPMQDARILYEGQHVALVVAQTLAQAEAAAQLVHVEYAALPAATVLEQALDGAVEVAGFMASDSATGDIDAGFAAADVVIDHAYTTADRHHNPMEPSATIAAWDGDRLTVHDSTQWLANVRGALAWHLGIPGEKVRVLCSFIGGGFGAKGYCWPHEVIAAAAARVIGRPLKVVLTRSQMATSHGYQTGSRQQIALGASGDGTLTAMRHTSVSASSVSDDYQEFTPVGTRALYACPAIETRSRTVHLNRINPTAMRAPHEGPGVAMLEIAMDELAYKLDIDPLELRLRNHALEDPTKGKPFSSKKLREAYQLAAERFGWSARSMAPRSMRDGRDLIGWGMATGIMTTFRFASSCRIRLLRSGQVTIEASAQEIGTGITTVVAQIAAEALGIPLERVSLVHGDSDLPQAGPATGSSSTMGLGSAVHDAAMKLRERLHALAGADGLGDSGSYGALLASHGLEELSAQGSFAPPAGASPLGEVADWSIATWGATFVEVRVDQDFMVPRLSRIVAAYSAGRIVNPRTARSQMIGGLIWGAGQALLEHSVTDPRLGRFMSKNLSGYLLPVNADIPAIDVQFVDEDDRIASPIGARGLGELGAVGVGGAIANAVFHATGVRIRRLPILPEMLLTGE